MRGKASHDAASMTATRQALGRWGEQLAAEHLRNRGFTVIERNARTRFGEIDLVAFDRSTLVFAEVKTRCLPGAGRTERPDERPLAGLGERQRLRIRRLATAWLADRERSRPYAETVRFDAIGVVLDGDRALRRIEHVEEAW
jgi:putative endonuclease